MYSTGYGGLGGYDPLRPGRAPRIQRFDEYYRCYPVVMAPGNDRPELNHGSKIILPPSALDKVSKMHVQWPLLMELINGAMGQHSHAGVLEFIAEEGRAYIPQWMMVTLGLDVGDMLQIRTTSLELAKMVKLQPQTTKFLDISDPKAVLERAFRNFATLTKGDIFSFEYNDVVYEVAVLDVKPETEKMGVSMIETDVSVEFAPPVGYVEPERQSGTSTPGSGKPGGGGVPAGGILHNQGTMAQAINYNAIAPSVTSIATNFLGEGQRLAKKGSANPTPKDSSPAPADPTPMRRDGAPAALRLPPNKLFFGYELKPVKTKAEKEEEESDSDRKPHFDGQGQTLRAAVKRKGEDDEREDSGSEKKGPGGGGRADSRPPR